MDISDVCQVCKIPNDQMLMLACPHDPCINCAASAYAQLVYIKNDNPNIFMCQICGQSTALDSSTISELARLSKNFVKLPSPSKSASSKKVGISLNNSEQINGKNAFYCKIHAQEELTYYCFTCRENICPECAIHGNHKDHDVKLIKKAINEVKSQFLQITNKIGGTQNNMNKYRDLFGRSIKESNERNTREKALVSQQFELLRNQLQIQEKEILKNLDIINKQNITLMTGFVDEITKLYRQIDKSKKDIEQILNRDEVLVFEEFKNIKTFQDSSSNLKKKSEEIVGTIQLLNSEFLQQEIKQITQRLKKVVLNTKKQKIGTIPTGSIRNVNNEAST